MDIQKARACATALTTRAMLRAGEGHYDEAWQDLLACHRLGRHIARGSSLIDNLVGIAIDSIASHADLVFLQTSKLSSNQIRAYQRDLQKLTPMPTLADTFDFSERFVALDTIMKIQTDELRFVIPSFGRLSEDITVEVAKGFLADIDLDAAMRVANGWHDRIVAALRAKDRRTREQQLDEINAQHRELHETLKESGRLLKLIKAPAKPAERGMLLGQMLTMWFGGVRKVQEAADRTEQTQRNLHLAFALAAYQRDNGHYPKKLDALAPKYLGKIPTDLYSGKALIYRPSDNGYLFYSLGVNGEDDGGRDYEDEPAGDDLRVRMPLPKLPRE